MTADPTTSRLKPTRIYWIVHHTLLGLVIQVLDITNQLLKHYDPALALDDAFKTRAKEVATQLRLKEKSDAEIFRCEKQNLLRTKWLLRKPSASASDPSADRLEGKRPLSERADSAAAVSASEVQQLEVDLDTPRAMEMFDYEDSKKDSTTWKPGDIAHIHYPIFASGATALSFPPTSRHSSHNITLKTKRWYLRSEYFVKDSVMYEWVPESLMHSRRHVLLRTTGEVKKEVAKLAMVWAWGFGEGGVLAVDESEDKSDGGIDGVVAVLGALTAFRKKRQRDGGRGGGGGGC